MLKTVSVVGFSEKSSFGESEMLSVTNFGLVLRVCIVNAIIVIKTLVNLFRISFYELLKVITMIILALLTKLWLVFFSLQI